MSKVINMNKSAGDACSCGGWLAHWIKFAGRTPLYCCEKNCTNQDLLGAFVKKIDGEDGSGYIVPLCKKHHTTIEPIEIGFTRLVPADKKITCG